MPRRADPTRRSSIAAAARRRLTSVGYDATTIGDLARELGISKAAIAYYFPSKDTFLGEFVTPVLDELADAVKRPTTPRRALSRYFDALVDQHDVAIWIDTDPVIQNHPVHGKRLRKINERLITVLADGSGEQSDRVRALSVLGGVWRPVRELTADELEAHRAEIIDAALSSS